MFYQSHEVSHTSIRWCISLSKCVKDIATQLLHDDQMATDYECNNLIVVSWFLFSSRNDDFHVFQPLFGRRSQRAHRTQEVSTLFACGGYLGALAEVDSHACKLRAYLFAISEVDMYHMVVLSVLDSFLLKQRCVGRFEDRRREDSCVRHSWFSFRIH